jgi:hypothetical protein
MTNEQQASGDPTVNVEAPTNGPGEAGPQPAPESSDITDDWYEEGEDDWDEADSILTWKLLVGLVVALVVVAVVAVALFGKKKDDTASGKGTTSGTNPSVPTIRDDFGRPDNPDSLGKTPGGEDWQSVLGTWGVKDRQAYVSQKNSGPRNIAVIDLGQGDGSVSAKAAKMTPGWGLVFRYRGNNAYWAIEAINLSPDKPTSGFKLLKFENGTPTNIQGANCIKQLSDGSEVRVEFAGPVISVLVDGKAICTVNDPYLQAQTKVGLFVTEQGVATARWSDFVATKGLANPPVTVKRQSPPATGGSTGQPGQAGQRQGQGQGGPIPSTTSSPRGGAAAGVGGQLTTTTAASGGQPPPFAPG